MSKYYKSGLFPREPDVRYLSAHHWIAFIWDSGPTFLFCHHHSPIPPTIFLLVLLQLDDPTSAPLEFCLRPVAIFSYADLINPLWFCVP